MSRITQKQPGSSPIDLLVHTTCFLYNLCYILGDDTSVIHTADNQSSQMDTIHQEIQLSETNWSAAGCRDLECLNRSWFENVSRAQVKNVSVKAPPMVGPTWTRVHLTLGLDCSPLLSQGTASLCFPTLCFIVCSRMSDVRWYRVVLVHRLLCSWFMYAPLGGYASWLCVRPLTW